MRKTVKPNCIQTKTIVDKQMSVCIIDFNLYDLSNPIQGSGHVIENRSNQCPHLK